MRRVALLHRCRAPSWRSRPAAARGLDLAGRRAGAAAVLARPDPYAGGQHRGVDIGGRVGARRASRPPAGTVSFAGAVPGGGRAVTIQTADGYAVTLLQLGSTTRRARQRTSRRGRSSASSARAPTPSRRRRTSISACASPPTRTATSTRSGCCLACPSPCRAAGAAPPAPAAAPPAVVAGATASPAEPVEPERPAAASAPRLRRSRRGRGAAGRLAHCERHALRPRVRCQPGSARRSDELRADRRRRLAAARRSAAAPAVVADRCGSRRPAARRVRRYARRRRVAGHRVAPRVRASS